MARRLDKIEKEMGYCEIKLEKELRLRKQVEFVEADLATLDSLLEILRRFEDALPPDVQGAFDERPSREAFFAAGLVTLTEEKRAVLFRDRDELVHKLSHYDGFERKKALLDQEKESLLGGLPEEKRARIREVHAEFKTVEQSWNQLTEDLTNIDDAIFYLGRNLDYLKSCRNFMIYTKGNLDLENGNPWGTLTDLFRHSSIGRAVEMADGADRNLRSSQKEMICVRGHHFDLEAFTGVLEAFVEALYEDLFEKRKIGRSIQIIEAALTHHLKAFEQIKELRAEYSDRLEEAEKARSRVFSKLGTGRSREAVLQ